MKFFNFLFKREIAVPTLALGFASSMSVALVFARIAWTKDSHYDLLVRNLILAWIPLVFALLARENFDTNQRRTWRFYVLAGGWLLFLPNAPYIVTDLIHLWIRFFRNFWIDMTLILLCALTGLLVGFVSLYYMQGAVARMFGRAASWLFVTVALGLSSLGVYLGRFLHLNSKDVFFRPGRIYQRIDTWVDGVPNISSAAFLILFATFLFVTYVMFYALTHLPRLPELESNSEPRV